MKLSFSKEITMGDLRMCGFDKEIEAFKNVDAGDLQFQNVVRNVAKTRRH